MGIVIRRSLQGTVFKNMEALASAGFRYRCAKAGAVFTMRGKTSGT